MVSEKSGLRPVYAQEANAAVSSGRRAVRLGRTKSENTSDCRQLPPSVSKANRPERLFKLLKD
jgi:hypothetical protein